MRHRARRRSPGRRRRRPRGRGGRPDARVARSRRTPSAGCYRAGPEGGPWPVLYPPGRDGPAAAALVDPACRRRRRAQGGGARRPHVRGVDAPRRGGRRCGRRGAGPDRQVARVRGAGGRRLGRADPVPRVRPQSRGPRTARGGRRRARRAAGDRPRGAGPHPLRGRRGPPPPAPPARAGGPWTRPRAASGRGGRPRGLRDGRDPADRSPAAGSGRHGPGPGPVRDGLGRRRHAHGGLPGRARHAPDAGQRPRRADHRGAAAGGRRRRWRAGRGRARHAAERRRPTSAVPAEPRHAVIAFPGGLRASMRWAGSGESAAVFALSEAGGPMVDLGELSGPDPDRRCPAEIRVDTPVGPWTVRLASLISDAPAGLLWDTEGLLVIKYGFHTYAFEARTGELRWSHRSASPILVLLGSSRLPHVLVQSEIETFAIRGDGEVAWRVAHSDVVTEAELVGGRLVLTSFGGEVQALDPATGRPAG